MMLRFNNFNLVRSGIYLFSVILALLTIVAFKQYPGQGYIYLLFTIISNGFLYLGFRKKAIFFDSVLSVFLWLGFWLKLTLRVGFTDGIFHESAGNFDGSGAAFDRGLLVASCGLLGLIVVTLIRGRFFHYKDKVHSELAQPGLFAVYQRHRKVMLAIFMLLCLSVALSNVYFGIYQRGQVPLTILPYGLGGVYKWLLLFGLASFGAVILQFEYVIGRSNSYLVAIISLLEGLLSNVSLLSRGMVLNSTALFYGLFKSFKLNAIPVKIRFFAGILLIFSVLFISSVFLVNHLRYSGFADSFTVAHGSRGRFPHSWEDANELHSMTTPLFIDRWVGMEGVLAVSSSHKEGWDLWRQGWREVYSDNSTSFFDLNLVNSPYLTADTRIHHYISLPGIIAFCFYPGSFAFLFACMLLVGAVGAGVEILVYRMGGKNLVLCSLLAQALAYRFTNFGYAPVQSYLLFGSLFLNLIIIYAAEKFFSYAYLVSRPVNNWH